MNVVDGETLCPDAAEGGLDLQPSGEAEAKRPRGAGGYSRRRAGKFRMGRRVGAARADSAGHARARVRRGVSDDAMRMKMVKGI